MRQIDKTIFVRITENGDVEILDIEDGSAITRLDANLYPVGSEFSTRYEHPEGIVLSKDDAVKAGISIE